VFKDLHAGEDVVPARFIAAYSDRYEVLTASGTYEAQVSGRLRFESLYSARNPAIGDWVAALRNPYGPYSITAVLPRQTCLQRQQASGLEAQVIGANIDRCLVLQAVQGDFSMARLDRYLAVVWDAGRVVSSCRQRNDSTNRSSSCWT